MTLMDKVKFTYKKRKEVKPPKVKSKNKTGSCCDISQPTTFRHIQHVAYNEDSKTFSISFQESEILRQIMSALKCEIELSESAQQKLLYDFAQKFGGLKMMQIIINRALKQNPEHISKSPLGSSSSSSLSRHESDAKQLDEVSSVAAEYVRQQIEEKSPAVNSSDKAVKPKTSDDEVQDDALKSDNSPEPNDDCDKNENEKADKEEIQQHNNNICNTDEKEVPLAEIFNQQTASKELFNSSPGEIIPFGTHMNEGVENNIPVDIDQLDSSCETMIDLLMEAVFLKALKVIKVRQSQRKSCAFTGE
ncbi:unnamed protein product [Trichobilharzia szidati]|nr:unnamed protein product [Trichobilharzia szidati]